MREERRAGPSQLSVVSLLRLCVALAGELLGLEAGHVRMFGTKRANCTQGSGREQVSLTWGLWCPGSPSRSRDAVPNLCLPHKIHGLHGPSCDPVLDH